MRHLGLHQRSLQNVIGKETLVQKMLNDQKDKLSNNPQVSNRTKRFQTLFMIERVSISWERYVFLPSCAVLVSSNNGLLRSIGSNNGLNRSFHDEAVQHERTGKPVKATASTLKIKRHMIERGNPLLKQQIMCQTVPEHVLVMRA